MIIGHGLIASYFEKDPFFKTSKDVLIFASGVSNSSETNPKKFELEKRLFSTYAEIYQDRVLYVYFSSSALSNNSILNIPYYKHKKEMEQLVSDQSKYLICRIPHLTNSSNNPHTLINYFFNAVMEQKKLQIEKSAKRYVIACDDLVQFLSKLIQSEKIFNITFNVANPYPYYAEEILNIIAKHIGKEPNYELVEGGFSYDLDLSFMLKECEKYNLDFQFGSNYLQNKLKNREGN